MGSFMDEENMFIEPKSFAQGPQRCRGRAFPKFAFALYIESVYFWDRSPLGYFVSILISSTLKPLEEGSDGRYSEF